MYSEPGANHLLLAFKPNFIELKAMPALQESARKDSSSSSNEPGTGIEQSKTDKSYEGPTLLDSRTYTHVLSGTPEKHSEPINYEKIITNTYDSLKVDSDSESTIKVLRNPETLEQDLDEFHKNQEMITAQANKELSLDAENTSRI